MSSSAVIFKHEALPKFQSRFDSTIDNIEVARQKVLNFIQSHDPSKVHVCDYISIGMIKMCNAAIVELLCIILEKDLATGQYPSM